MLFDAAKICATYAACDAMGQMHAIHALFEVALPCRRFATAPSSDADIIARKLVRNGAHAVLISTPSKCGTTEPRNVQTCRTISGEPL